MPLKVFTCIDHVQHYPVGGASVVVAEDEQSARELLVIELRKHHLEPDNDDPFTLIEIALTESRAYVLRDGEY